IAAGALPASLLAATARAAARFAGGAAGAVPGRAAALAEGALRAGRLTRLKVTAALCLALALTVAGAALLPRPAAPPAGGRPRPPPPAPPWPPGPPPLRVTARSRPHAPFRAVASSPAGKVIATGADAGDATVRLWDTATGRQIRRLKGHSLRVNALAFSPDG